jgi:GNAT superfamily N-acetyltransferase
MDNTIEIKQAGIEDISVIRTLAEEVWPSTYQHILSAGQISYMMDLFYSSGSLTQQFARDSFIIACLDNDPVGFASYNSHSSDGIYKLHKLYVRSTTQGRGLGSALIHFIIASLKLKKARALDLNVNRHNKALVFYEKKGFKIIYEEDIDIGNNFWMNDYVMRLQIN